MDPGPLDFFGGFNSLYPLFSLFGPLGFPGALPSFYSPLYFFLLSLVNRVFPGPDEGPTILGRNFPLLPKLFWGMAPLGSFSAGSLFTLGVSLGGVSIGAPFLNIPLGVLVFSQNLLSSFFFSQNCFATPLGGG